MTLLASARIALLAGIAGVIAGPARAERLPIRTYTTADGLAENQVIGVERDSKGFLWLRSSSGLSRFDGRFVTRLGPEEGLPEGLARAFLETRDGVLLAGFYDGLYWHDPSAPRAEPIFRAARPAPSGDENIVNVLHEDAAGTLWCGTHRGLYRATRTSDGFAFERVDHGADPADIEQLAVSALLTDPDGSIWVGTINGLFERRPNGETVRYTPADGLPGRHVTAMMRASDGTRWVGTPRGPCTLVEAPERGRPVVARSFTTADGLRSHDGSSGTYVYDLAESSDGRIWLSTLGGLSEHDPRARPRGPAFRTYGKANGLSGEDLNGIVEDLAGNLWIGSGASGLAKLVRGGFTTFGTEDGLGDERIMSLLSDRSGALCAISGYGNAWINRFDGKRFTGVRLGVDSRVLEANWGWGQIGFEDATGAWWFSTFQGIVRFPPVSSFERLARTQPAAVYTTRDGLLSNGIFRLWEDARGDAWIGVMDYFEPRRNGLQCRRRETGTIDSFEDVEGLPRDPPTAFLDDGEGGLWVGFYRRGVGRLRGRSFDLFSGDGAPPAGFVNFLHRDRQGRLWIGTSRHGLYRVDDPGSRSPTFVRYDTERGLSDNGVEAIAEDRWGKLYLATSRGVDRLDPATGEVRHYTAEDGLGTLSIGVAHADREGALWFGASSRLARLVPEPAHPAEPPSVRIRGVRVAGIPRPVFVFGETEILDLELAPDQRQIEIELAGSSLSVGERLEFQYRLGDAWSRPIGEPRVHFANLAAGRYRFEVRAVNSEGLVSTKPAVMSFRVLPPFWQRAWFLSLVAVLVAASAYAAHRARLRRLLALERIRTRIATDLHDDIGSSLSQVSILSEVVRQQVRGGDPRAAEPLLDEIARVARELVQSMSDIVWAINPERDRTADLVQRMRLFASDTFGGKDVAFRFDTSTGDESRRLGIDLRRQVYLVFKEAVNNAVRHSGCTEAEVVLRIEERNLTLRVQDDGRGFEPGSSEAGHGLASMRARAAALRGTLEVESAPRRGTTVLLRIPL